MELFEIVAQYISSHGFPIVACVALFVYMMHENKEHRAEVKELTTALNNTTLSMTEALNANTSAIERLSDRLGV